MATCAEPVRDIEAAIIDRVAQRAEHWFPDLTARPKVTLARLVERPRAVLYGVRLGAPSGPPHLLAKVRRSWPGGADGGWTGSRPRLASSPLDASAMTALEFRGLCQAYEMTAPGHAEFAAVRPLDHLVDVDTILMDYVRAATLRQLLVQENRLSVRRLWMPRRSTPEVWQRVGSWLRLWQQSTSVTGLPARQETRLQVAEQMGAYGDFLTTTLGRDRSGDAGRRGAELAASLLPERLGLAVGHGDFAPRNVFLMRDGRIAIFDPLPRWAVPRLEDLCRFLVAFRLLGIQLHSHGAAYGARELAQREQDIVAGYTAGGESISLAELRCFQLLLTLDTWAGLVDGRSGSWRQRLRRSSVDLAAGHLRRETDRLIALAEAGR